MLAWGAVDAVAPDPNVPQQQFKLDYAGGWGKYRKVDVLAHVQERLPPVRRPGARLRRRRVHGTRRLALGAPELAARPAAARRRCLSSRAHGLRAPPLALGRPSSPCSRSRRTGRTAALFRACSAGCSTAGSRSTASRRHGDRRATETRATCTSTRSTPRTARVGSATGEGDARPAGGFCYSFAPLLRPPPGYPSIPDGLREGRATSGHRDGSRSDAGSSSGRERRSDRTTRRSTARTTVSSTRILGADKVCGRA